jgi:Protein of unknown function (DUF3570)
MRILTLAALGMYFSILSAFSQSASDSSQFKSRKLKLEEVDIVSAYYSQDGNNSAVTGGIGSEKLTDYTNSIEVKMLTYDKKQRKNQFRVEFGIDHYTSASSDQINPKTISSASTDDTRLYPSVAWSRENEKKGTSVGIVASHSREADYFSYGLGINFSKTSANKNRELDISLQSFFDHWKVILPEELRPTNYGTGAKNDQRPVDREPRNSYSASLNLSQVINKRLQLSLIAEPTYQEGLLATKFHRVYFVDGTLKSENLPGRRFKLPIGMRANYFIGDHVIIRSLYRFFKDDWGMQAHTIEMESTLKFSSFLSVTPFYRFHTQTAIDHFAPFEQHQATQSYYSSDYDMSALNSHFYGAGFRLSPPKGVLGIKNWNVIELRYGHYNRTTRLESDVISMHVKFK